MKLVKHLWKVLNKQKIKDVFRATHGTIGESKTRKQEYHTNFEGHLLMCSFRIHSPSLLAEYSKINEERKKERDKENQQKRGINKENKKTML